MALSSSRSGYRLRPLAAFVSLSLLAAAGTPGLAREDEPTLVEGVLIHGPPPPDPPAVVARDELGRVTLRATRLEEPIVLDGALDEPVYRSLPPVGDFVQQEPREGAPATEKTEAWVLFDDRYLYVAARCWDSHPERMVANEMRRDSFDIFQNENFTVVLDTFYDRRNGFFFQTNPLGALRDQLVTDEGNSNNTDWNTVWDVRARRSETGWTVEMAIPFKSLRYKQGGPQIWGINLRRVIRWKNEQVFLSRVPASFSFRGIYKFSSAATLVGLEAPPLSTNLELKPYGISTVTTNREATPPFSNDAGADAGFDLKYGITSGLVADFTYNTDFAQVEEDDQQVNLTRFSLFFPEKRDFFLEGQGIFAFGGVQLRGGLSQRPGDDNPELTPILFFSRRIGLAGGGVVPILAGGRVTGRAGKYRLGILDIQTEQAPAFGQEATHFSVVRVRRDFLRRSDIGIIATHRSRTAEGFGSNSVFGLDTNLAFYQNVRVNAYYARSRTSRLPATGAEPASYLARLDYAADRYGVELEHLYVGDGFRPEIGFLRREAFRRSFARLRFSPRPRSIESIRKLTWEADLDYITGADGALETRRLGGAFRIELERGDQMAVELARRYELLARDFPIAANVVIPTGGYDFQDVRLIYELGPQREVPGFVTFRRGSFFSGDRTEVAYSGRVEVSPKLSVEPRLAVNWVDLVEGRFVTRLLSTRVNLTLTPRMLVASLLQFNSSNDTLSSSVRFRWEYQPGSDFFVVYSEGRNTELDGFPGLANRTFAVKLTRLLRF